jgi:hypothetical protein
MNGSTQAINIVFDGPPGPDGGQFIEVETDDGHSLRIGQWLEHPKRLRVRRGSVG